MFSSWLLNEEEGMKKLKFLSIAIGFIYVWFGILKFFPSLSPAESLAANTIEFLSFGLITPKVGTIVLAVAEVLIGFGLIFTFKMSWVVRIAIAHMIFTFTPLFIFPEIAFNKAPYSFTITGQYIMKNVVIIAALVLLIPAKKKVINPI